MATLEERQHTGRERGARPVSLALDPLRLAVALDNVDRELEPGWTPAHYARAIADEYGRVDVDARPVAHHRGDARRIQRA